MEQQTPITPDTRADDPKKDAASDDGTHEVAPDLAYQRLAIVNTAFITDFPMRATTSGC